MKNTVEKRIKKTFIYKYFISKIINKFENMEYENQLIANENIDMRLKFKKINNEKINVVFICHRPAVWESLHSVYDAMKSDELFNVSIVAIPNKKELPQKELNHEIYESEGAEEFWRDYGCINGYNYDTKEWFDLRKLNPDYVFFQQPYNVTRCPAYKSMVVSKYAKICYVNYFSPINFGERYEECTPSDFMHNISFYFTQNKRDHEFIQERYTKINNFITNIFMTGYPAYDKIGSINKESDIWTDKHHNRFRIVWTPRWTTNEGNCHFFKFKDKIISFCKRFNVELVFRPHPQAFSEWNATGEFTSKQQEQYRLLFEQSPYLHLDESSQYLEMLYSSDCLISDPSSIMYDYFLTGNPVIYCKSNKKQDYAELLEPGLYHGSTWNDVEEILQDLIKGKDVLKGKRKQIIESNFFINSDGTGNVIKELIKNDAVK